MTASGPAEAARPEADDTTAEDTARDAAAVNTATGTSPEDAHLLDGTPPDLRSEARADLGPAAVLAGLTLLAGAGVGVLWAVVAPGATVVAVGGDVASVGGEGGGAFDATALFALLVAALGVLVGGLAWRVRAHRGPVLMVTAVLAAVAAAAVAGGVGVLLASGTPPVGVLLDRAAASASRTPGPPVPAQLRVEAPDLGTWWTVVLAGVAAALGYLVPAIVLGLEDMDRDG